MLSSAWSSSESPVSWEARQKWRLLALALFPLIGLGTFLAYPLMNLLARGLGAGPLSPLLADPFFWHVLGFTYGQALVSTIAAAVVGTLGAVLWSEQAFVGKRAFWHLSLICFSLPAIVVCLALVGFWGKYGWVNRAAQALHLAPVWENFYGWPPIILAHTFFNYPLFLKGVGRALRDTDREEEKVALSLGASRLTCFFRLTLRKIYPALASHCLLCFLYCSTSFLVVLLLGGGPRFTVIEVAIYEAIKVQLDLPLAVRLALIQMLVSAALYFLFLRASSFGTRAGVSAADFIPLYLSPNRPAGRWTRRLYFLGMFFLVLGPLACVLQSGLPAFPHLPALIAPLLHSLELAALTSAFAVSLAFVLAYLERHWPNVSGKNLISLACGFPLSLSGVILTLSWMTAFPEWYWKFRGNLVAVAILQSIIALPVVHRPLRDGFFRIPDDIYRVTASLGAGAGRALLEVELPYLRRPLWLAFLCAAAFSLGEIGSCLLLLSEPVATLPLWIYYRLGQYRFADAYAGGALLLVLMAVSYGLMGAWEERKGESA